MQALQSFDDNGDRDEFGVGVQSYVYGLLKRATKVYVKDVIKLPLEHKDFFGEKPCHAPIQWFAVDIYYVDSKSFKEINLADHLVNLDFAKRCNGKKIVWELHDVERGMKNLKCVWSCA